MKNLEIGNILSVNRGIIVHGCNAQGVMGSGIAKQIRELYPKAYAEYKRKYDQFGLELGEVIFVEIEPDLYIANAITQQSYGRDEKQRYVSHRAIREAFYNVALFAQVSKLPIHYPLIGAGLANGDWSVISQIIDSVITTDSIERTLWIQD